MASPGWNDLAESGVDVEDVDVDPDVDPDMEPIGTAMKPMASRYLPKRWIVSGAKLASESGTAIGFVSPLAATGWAAHSLSAIDVNVSSTFCAVMTLRNSAPDRRGAASWAIAPAEAPLVGICSISSIGVMPAIGSLANCQA